MEKEEKNETKKSHGFINFIIFIIVVAVGLVLYSKYLGTSGLIVKEYRVDSNILTSNFSGLKIVHFSDLLYKSTIDENDLKELVNKINILKPDIVVFTGDLANINIKLTENDKNILIKHLSKIEAKIGKYAIYGDYDYSYTSYESVMNESRFTILNNTYEEIFYNTNDSLYLVGLPSSIKENIDMDESFKFYDDKSRKYTIVLVHDGNTIKYIDDSVYEVDLILGGHSLNGSVVVPFYGSLFVDKNSYKYYAPTYEKGITKVFISSGLGTNKYEYRLLNKPSFNFYRLKSTK